MNLLSKIIGILFITCLGASAGPKAQKLNALKFSQFQVTDVTPIEAPDRLVKATKKEHGEIVDITISEFAKDLPLERKLGAHRRISIALKDTTFGEAFVAICNAARWHWNVTDDKYIVYAWHKGSD